MVKFENGCVVWSKLANYPYWPSRITKLSEVKPKSTREQLSQHHPEDEELVWFFGSHNYSWVPKSQIYDYQAEYDEFSTNRKAPKSFSIALKEAARWIARGNKPSESEIDSEDEESPSESESDAPGRKSRKTKTPPSTKKKPGRRGRKRKIMTSESESEQEEEEEEEEEEQKQKVLPKRSTRGRRKNSDQTNSPNKKSTPTTRQTRSSSRQEKSIPNSPSPSPKANGEHSKLQTGTPKKLHEKKGFSDSDKSNDESNASSLPRRKLNSEGIAQIVASLIKHPVSKYHKLAMVNYSEGYAETKATFSDARASSKVEVHSCLGATYHLLDLTSLIAAVHSLYEDESAITQDIHATVLAPVAQGSEITIKAKVQKIKRPFIFVECEVYHEDMLVVTGKVIKSTSEPHVNVKCATG